VTTARPSQAIAFARERFELQDYYACIHLLEELIDEGRAFADAHHMVGLSYQLIGHPERALEAFESALELNPRYIEAHIHRGIVLGELGRSDEAAAAFATAREIASDHRGELPRHHSGKLANLHAELGEAYAEAGALSEAIDQYQAGLRLRPEFHDLRYRLGRLLLEAGRSLEAREEFERLVRARPNAPDPKAAFGLACYVSGDAAAARDVWEQLARERPDDLRAKAYLAMLERGTVE
jgi:tetratricopeptide (TPR) repeat protein